MQSVVKEIRSERGTAAAAPPTVWGLTATELHDAFWVSRGVHCVRAGDALPLDRSADLFLLTEPGQLALFDLRGILERLIWSGAMVTRLRIPRSDDSPYQERIVSTDGLVQRIERRYGPDRRASTRVFLTRRTDLAELWRRAATPRDGWKKIRMTLRGMRIDSIRLESGWSGSDRVDEHEAALQEIVARWNDPDRAIEGIEQVGDGVWTLKGEAKPTGPTVVGPAWLGAGWCSEPGSREADRLLNDSEDGPQSRDSFIIGPAFRPDVVNGVAEPAKARVRGIFDIVSGDSPRVIPREHGSMYPFFKRVFDLLVSSTALVVLLPLLLLIAVAIIIDSGRPVLFAHRRQSRGGVDFNCLKFRTMRKDAEELVHDLAGENRCDGPQVFIPNDPRVTRVGHILRHYNLDELPQLLNVLAGQMSIVGPRPSPERENRYCPAWRETRLSVRPGITGLWQVNRTRAEGEDFQEWIRYDIEYVKRATFFLDLLICLQTVRVLLLGRKS